MPACMSSKCVCIYVTVWTGLSVGYMCVGCTAAYIGMHKGVEVHLDTIRKGVYGEPRLPDCIRHGLPTPYTFSDPTRFSEACPNILKK